jgi:hypothetical protein
MKIKGVLWLRRGEEISGMFREELIKILRRLKKFFDKFHPSAPKSFFIFKNKSKKMIFALESSRKKLSDGNQSAASNLSFPFHTPQHLSSSALCLFSLSFLISILLFDDDRRKI